MKRVINFITGLFYLALGSFSSIDLGKAIEAGNLGTLSFWDWLCCITGLVMMVYGWNKIEEANK